MTALQLFFHLLYVLDHSSATCSDLTGTPLRVAYQGNCAQAFLYSLFDHAVYFVQNPPSVVTG